MRHTQELQEKAKGGDLFAQGFEWLDQARVRRNNLAHAAAAAFFSLRAQPNGTREKPVVVTSTLSSRIVGATDGDDDSIIHWGIVHEGQDPVKSARRRGRGGSVARVAHPRRPSVGEEWFILKRNADGGAPGHH